MKPRMEVNISFRTSKGLRDAANAVATERQENVSDVLRAALGAYVTSAAICDCMTEDPGDGYGERVVTHSGACYLHPENDDDAEVPVMKHPRPTGRRFREA